MSQSTLKDIYSGFSEGADLVPLEACAIKIRDINFDESPTRLHIRAEYTKTKRSPEIFIFQTRAAHYLKEWIEDRFGIMY